MQRTRLLAAGAALVLTLSACGSSDAGSTASPESTGSTEAGSPTSSAGGATSTDLNIGKVDDIAAMLPESVTADGKLTIATEASYAPGEFYAEDGTTLQGYDIDLANALGQVFGLEVEIQDADFASIIPAIGSTYELGLASFTITEEREQVAHMIQYFEAGLQWAVPAGNPQSVDPNNVCGLVVGVQTGTTQDDYLQALNEGECADNPVQIQRQETQSRVTLDLTSGQIDAMFADAQIVDYAISLTNGQAEKIGEPIDVAPVGLAVSKTDDATAQATVAALEYLMDEGHMADIFATWGISDGVQTTPILNPLIGN